LGQNLNPRNFESFGKRGFNTGIKNLFPRVLGNNGGILGNKKGWGWKGVLKSLG